MLLPLLTDYTYFESLSREQLVQNVSIFLKLMFTIKKTFIQSAIAN